VVEALVVEMILGGEKKRLDPCKWEVEQEEEVRWAEEEEETSHAAEET